MVCMVRTSGLSAWSAFYDIRYCCSNKNMADDLASEHYANNCREVDDEENDKFLAQYFTKTPEYEDNRSLFRPLYSDVQMIGFYQLDRTTQTEESEVVKLKEMTAVVSQLMKDAQEMKRDINFTKHVLQADFETKLQGKATDMYCSVNEKLDDIERLHKDKVGTIRRAFRQQLADAIARLHSYHNQSIFLQMSNDEEHRKLNAEKANAKLQGLQATIQRQQALINMLEGQIAERTATPEVRPPSRSESVLKELDSLQDQIDTLQKYIKRKEKEIKGWEEVNEDLKKDIKALGIELENERKLTQQLKDDREELRKNAQMDAAATQRQMEKQRLQLKKEAEEKMKKIQEQAQEKEKEIAENQQSQEQERYNTLLKEKQHVEQLLIQEKEKRKENSKDAEELEKLKRNEIKLQYDVSKLRKELEKTHALWEKKFHILQQSLHALKDESYLRQTLQKQAATLHTAAISYAYDSPMGITATKQVPTQSHFKKPLPNISANAKSPQDFISYTVSAPSGRATALLPIDENQVMSDDEAELPTDVVPIKSNTSLKGTKVSDDQESIKASSTKSHVVVLPTVEAQ